MAFDPSVLDLSYDDLYKLFSGRVAQALRMNNITSMRELVIHTEKQILDTPNLGRRSLKEIKNELEKIDLRLGMTEDDIESLIDSSGITYRTSPEFNISELASSLATALVNGQDANVQIPVSDSLGLMTATLEVQVLMGSLLKNGLDVVICNNGERVKAKLQYDQKSKRARIRVAPS